MNDTTTFETLIEKALQNENLQTYKLQFRGGNEKGEGYIGNISFMDVFAKKIDGSEKVYHLVLKIGGRNKTLRPIVRLGFEREIHIYSKVIPAFWKLQQTHCVPLFTCMPKCYLTILTDTQEALVLHNIKFLDFQLHDRKTVMDLDHIKLVLTLLSQWHALSFALKHKEREQFVQLTSNWNCPATEMFVKSHVGGWMNLAQKHLFAVLEENGELNLLSKYKDMINNQPATLVVENVLKSQEDKVVVTHGDCWNNNLMFKYQAENSSEVAIIDFQLSNISSPVIDLSYFIYAVSSESELEHFNELLQTYHAHLSQCLIQLDCSPEQLFSFSDLVRHWKKYSAYGAMINPMIVCDNLVDKEDAVCYGNKNEKYESILESVDRKQNELFTSRLIAVAKHFTCFADDSHL